MLASAFQLNGGSTELSEHRNVEDAADKVVGAMEKSPGKA